MFSFNQHKQTALSRYTFGVLPKFVYGHFHTSVHGVNNLEVSEQQISFSINLARKL